MAEYNELQSLTTPKGAYDSFPDKEARKRLDEAKFNSLTLETANANDGDNGVILTPEGTQDAPVLVLYGKNGDEPVRVKNVAEGVDDDDVPNLGQVKALIDGQDSGQNAALTFAQIDLLENAFERIQWADAAGPQYAAQLIASLRGSESGGDTEEPDTTKTLESISAEYTGGNVPVGTALNSLSGVTVTAHYSDGSTANVTGYTLSGTIAEGDNTVTVTYMGKTATITIVGEAQSADGRKLLHNWVLSDAEGSEIDTVGGATVGTYQTIEKTADGWVNNNGWSYIKCSDILSINRTVEVDISTAFNSDGTNDIRALFTLGDGSSHAQRYWLDYRKKTNVWGWTDTSTSYNHAAAIDGLTGADVFSGKTVALSINADGFVTLWLDGQYIGASPFTVADATRLNIGKNTEGFHETTVSAIRVYEGVL